MSKSSKTKQRKSKSPQGRQVEPEPDFIVKCGKRRPKEGDEYWERPTPKNELTYKCPRMKRCFERTEILARPTARRLRSLWDEKCDLLPADRRDKIKSALEEDYFLSPEQTEQYFLSLGSKRWSGVGDGGGGGGSRATKNKEDAAMERELQLRQKWLVNFSAQVAYCLCDYIAKGQQEMLVSNRLRSIADVVLERIAEILGVPKPSRSNPGRLARFMVAISDRIAVWIENAVYRADAYEPSESGICDEHVRLDADNTIGK